VRLVHVRLLPQRFDETLRFYRDTLRLPVAWYEDGGPYVSFDAGPGIRLALYRRDAMAAAVGAEELPADPGGQDRAALIFEVDSVDASFELLRDRGVPFATEPHDRPDWGIRVAHLRDPDGALIELSQRLTAT
jgi:lactoylglutathione lyase